MSYAWDEEQSNSRSEKCQKIVFTVWTFMKQIA